MKKILMLAVFIFGFTGIISASAAGVVIDSARVNFTGRNGLSVCGLGKDARPPSRDDGGGGSGRFVGQ